MLNLIDKTILIIDDSDFNLSLLADILAQTNANLATAISGNVALEMFLQSPMWHYSLILTDVNMPGMNGIETMKYLKELPRDDAKCVPVIAMSSDFSIDDLEYAQDIGITGFVAKPYNKTQLFNEIEKIFRTKEER